MATKPTPTPRPNTTTNKKPKLLFTLSTPFPAVQWPTIPPDAQTEILEHLSNILSPIGARKRLLPPSPSTAKRNRKRKRAPPTTTAATVPPPPLLEISEYLTIGLNSTTAYLEGLAGELRPVVFAPATQEGKESRKPAMRAVFAARADLQASLLHSHIPLLCGLASGEGGSAGVVRLVQLPRGSEARLANALGITRAGFVGLLEGAPEEEVAGLMEVVERCVPPVQVPWLEGEQGVGEYRAVNVKVVKTYATVQEKGKGKVKGSAPA